MCATARVRRLRPWDQSESMSDIRLTARIRRAIVDDSRLSTTAKNIKIITVNGQSHCVVQ